MERKSVTQDILDRTDVLRYLEAFLSPRRAQLRHDKNVPIDIVERTTVILRKWQRGDLSALPLRGLIRNGFTARFDVNPVWLPRRTTAAFFGHGDLVNGQRWPNRVAMNRDGAHGPLVAGISGKVNGGAYSVVMGLHDINKPEFYADVDLGEIIWYVGTALPADEGDKPSNVKETWDERQMVNPDIEPTNATRTLMKSQETQIPVRVFRSFRLAEIVPNKPRKGFRYDGLYRVVERECMHRKRQIHRFKMVRLRDREGEYAQGPIRDELADEPQPTGSESKLSRQRRRRVPDSDQGRNVRQRTR